MTSVRSVNLHLGQHAVHSLLPNGRDKGESVYYPRSSCDVFADKRWKNASGGNSGHRRITSRVLQQVLVRPLPITDISSPSFLAGSSGPGLV
jgi:hypothetical protein